MAFHDEEVGESIHPINANPNSTGTGYTDIAERDADTNFNTDALNVNKVVRVESPLSYYVLTSISPTWSEFTSTGSDTWAEILTGGNVSGGTDVLVSSGDELQVADVVTIGSLTSPPTDVSLNLSDPTKAFLVNQGTTAQRDAITPIEGMQFHNLDVNDLEFYNGTAWQSMGGGDVVGPASSVDNSIPTFNGTSGKNIQDPNIIFTDGTNVGINIASPDASAILELQSASKGFLGPRGTEAERDNIASPATGLQFYNLDDLQLEVFDGSTWKKPEPEETLQVVLGFGNTTGGNSIDVSSGDTVIFGDGSTQDTGSTPDGIGFHPSTLSNVQSSSLNSEDAQPLAIFVRADGLKLYMTGNVTDDIFEYDMTVPWDVSTLSFFQTFIINQTAPRGLYFKPDGTKFYVQSFAGVVIERTMSTPWDITTASQTGSFTATGSVQGMWFKPDGLAFYNARAGTIVQRYDLTTAWDLSTASDPSISATVANGNAVSFRPDGRSMYSMGGTNISEYELSTPWDITTLNLIDTITVSIDVSETIFKPDGTKAFILDATTDLVHEFNLGIKTDNIITSNIVTDGMLSTDIVQIQADTNAIIGVELLDDVGTAQASFVYSDLLNVTDLIAVGNLAVESGGDLLVESIAGDLTLKSLSNDILLEVGGGVGIGSTPIASALVNIASVTKGFMQPRLTTTQRDAISSPATGLSIYNSTTNEPEYFNGTSWSGSIVATLAETLVHGSNTGGNNIDIDNNDSIDFGAGDFTITHDGFDTTFLQNVGDLTWVLGGANGFEIDLGSTDQNSTFTIDDSAGTNLFKVLGDGRVGVGSGALEFSSEFSINSTTRGFLPPRMTQAQRDAIAGTDGLIIHNLDRDRPEFHGDTDWQQYSVVASAAVEIFTSADLDDLATAGVITLSSSTTYIINGNIVTDVRFAVTGGATVKFASGDFTSTLIYTGTGDFVSGNGGIRTDSVDLISTSTGTLLNLSDSSGSRANFQATFFAGWDDLGSVDNISVLVLISCGFADIVKGFTVIDTSVETNIVGLVAGVIQNGEQLFNISGTRSGIGVNIVAVSQVLVPSASLVRIDPGISEDVSIGIRGVTITSGDLFDTTGGIGGVFDSVADAAIASTTINSVTDSGGVARFNFTVGPTLFVNQEVDIVNFVTQTNYNQTGIITATGAGFFEIASIPFTADDATGDFSGDSVTLTETLTALVDGDTLVINTSDSTDYDGGATVYNQLTNSFQINRTFTVTKSGEYSTAGINQTDSRVLANNNPGFSDSQTVGFGTTNGESTATTVIDGTYAEIQLGTMVSDTSSERIKLIDASAGIWEITSNEPVTGNVDARIWHTKTGSDQNYRMALSINGAVPVFATAQYAPMGITTLKQHTTGLFPISGLVKGDTIQLMSAGDGTTNSPTFTDIVIDIVG